MIYTVLILLCLLAFGIAYYFRDKHLSNNIYDAVTCFSAALIIGVVFFDFLPHQLSDFLGVKESCAHNAHDHAHEHHHHDTIKPSVDYWQYLLFGGLVLIGFLFQILLEKIFHFKFSSRLENIMLVLGLFLHSFSETAILYGVDGELNKVLFTGILFHKLPIAFVLAYTLLSRASVKTSLLWFSIFLLSVPLGSFCNNYINQIPKLFNIVSILVSGMMLHVVCHILESVKLKEKWNLALLVIGALCAYGITLFHAH